MYCRKTRARECRSELSGSLVLTADDAVIFTKTTEVLAEALESLSEEADSLGLRVPWMTMYLGRPMSRRSVTSRLQPLSQFL